jgi:hypothetical protein
VDGAGGSAFWATISGECAAVATTWKGWPGCRSSAGARRYRSSAAERLSASLLG